MITDAGAEPTLSVSIVLHESDPKLLEDTLRTVHASICLAQRAGSLGAARVVLLDNGSSSAYVQQILDIVAVVEPEFRPVLAMELRIHPDNPGFGIGHNRAQEGSESEYLLILNPDLELEADALDVALSYLRLHSEVAAVNPYCERRSGEREFLCKRYPSVWDLLLRGGLPPSLRQRFDKRLARYEYRDLPEDSPSEVELLSGACFLCRRAAFRAAGGFDTRYFMYFEDFDLSRRLTGAGTLVFVPRMRVVHHGGFAARKGLRHIGWFLASAIRFFQRHGWNLR